MPTSEERREVAERLRNEGRALDAIDATVELASLTLDDALGIDHMSGWCDLFDTLADLIDPTCYPVPSDDRSISCSECGERIGAMLPPIGAVLPHYCQHCGARVKRGGER